MTRTLNRLQIPSRTEVLANGMRVVAHEERSSPIVAVHLMYHVGSKDEVPGRTGIAHLLEHLMFEGSEHCPKGEFDTLLEAVGGSNNGSTWLDRTNYYETVPSHAVELALWLERDRMAHFLPVLDDEMLETQRGVVINERRQSYESRPYGRADERLQELLFGRGHPYAWPTIGYMADLEAIRLEDVQRFYESFYTPANAVLVLAGDVAADDVFALAERYFGDLRAGAPPPSRMRPFMTERTAPPREVMEDRVSFPRIYRAAAVPPYGTPDWVALDVLAYLLADGDSSPMQRLVVRDKQLAQDVDTYLYPTELHGIFGMVATARSGVDAAAVEEALLAVVEEVAENGAPPDELAGAIRRARRDQVASLSLVEERAEALAFAATVLGSADQLEPLMDSYAAVTPEDLARVAREFLDPERAAVVTVVPVEGADGR